MSSAFQVDGLLIKISKKIAALLMKIPSLLMAQKIEPKILLMDKVVATLLICSFSDDGEVFAHYSYTLSCYIMAVTGGCCFERTEISFISFRWWIQTNYSVLCSLEEQPDCTRQIHRWSWRCSLQSAFRQEKKTQNQIYINVKEYAWWKLLNRTLPFIKNKINI